MGDMLKLIWWAVIGLFRSRVSLEAEILTLCHQLNVLRRKSPKRFTFSNFDRLVFASLYRIAPRVANALVILPTPILGGLQVPVAKNDDMVKTFPPDQANQPFRMAILPWRLGHVRI